jgi:hypothetical protein
MPPEADPCKRVGRFYEERLNLVGFSVVKSGPDENRCIAVCIQLRDTGQVGGPIMGQGKTRTL